MPIQPPASAVPPRSPHAIQVGKRTTVLPLLVVGEIVEIEVMEGFDGKNGSVSIKGHVLPAHSELPLKAGESRTVRIEQLYPRLVLKNVPLPQLNDVRIGEYLRHYNANPKAMTTLCTEALYLFDPGQHPEVLQVFDDNTCKHIQKILQSLILSKESGHNDFVKQYVNTIGFLMEGELARAAEKKFGRALHFRQATGSLKGLFGDLLARLAIPGQHSNEAEPLGRFLQAAMHTLEAQQVVNVVSQEREQTYILQVPLMFPETLGLAELFITVDNEKSHTGVFPRKCQVLFLLTMDALGEIVMDAAVDGRKITCRITCENRAIRDFVVPHLSEITGKLEALGYSIGHIECSAQEGLTPAEVKHDRVGHLFNGDGVNVIV